MPTYEYRRADGSMFEIMQRITEPALETCPTTGQPVKRLIGGGAGLIFKGSGFYETDYVRKKSPEKSETKKKEPAPKTNENKSSSENKTSSTKKKPATSET